MHDVDQHRVTALLRRVSEDEILPRFRSLHELVIEAKPSPEDPEDIVTEADRAAEAVLAAELVSLAPGSVAIGEEAASGDASLRDALGSAPLAWLIDPLDGTKNFAAGRETFGTMVTLCRHGDAIASWIHLPVPDEMLVALKDEGAWLDGLRIHARAPNPEEEPLQGVLLTSFMPPDVRERVERNAEASVRRAEPFRSAAWEYSSLARGLRDFALYWRLLPWDHAPGALLLSESGGALRHADGRPYRATDRDTFALAVRHADLWERARAELI